MSFIRNIDGIYQRMIRHPGATICQAEKNLRLLAKRMKNGERNKTRQNLE